MAQTATLETASELSPADKALPERTQEGYRIIRIQKTETKAYKDSVKKVERQIEEDKKPTIPFRLTYEYTYLIAQEKYFLKTNESNASPWFEEKNREPEKEHITQMRVSFPLLFALKGQSSPAMFEVGTKISIPIQDKYKSINLVDYDLRPSVDVAFLIGGTAIVNKYLSITGHLEIQTQDVYDNELFVGVTDIMCLAYRIGVLFTPF